MGRAREGRGGGRRWRAAAPCLLVLQIHRWGAESRWQAARQPNDDEGILDHLAP